MAYLGYKNKEFLKRVKEKREAEEAEQPVDNINAVQSDHLDTIMDDINDSLYHMDITAEQLCDAIPPYIMRTIYKDMLARIGRDIVENKYEY